ncbi:M23 family metallopeptidase [bacterium]|nr:M23 family metallopeptidase [bacterium]
MKKQTFLLTLVMPSKGKNFSTMITSYRILGGFITISLLYFALYFPFLETGKTKLLQKELNTAQAENAVMRQNFYEWQNRVKKAESFLLTLKNKYDVLTEDSIGTASYTTGIGGISANPMVDIVDVEYKNYNDNIYSLENEIYHLKNKVLVISTHLSVKKKIIDHYPSIRPVKGGWVSSGFGNRMDPFTRKMELHNGLDISIKMNSNVFATADGIVKKINQRTIQNKGYGKYIILDHGYGFQTLYAHLDKINVKVGDKISRWQVIGLSGNTGKSTGPHLHYAVYHHGKEKDPNHFILSDHDG